MVPRSDGGKGGRTPARRPRAFSAVAIALATTVSAWPAAGYGALVIWAAGNFAATGTLWIFQWPFLTQLVVATVLHLLAVGAGEPLGIPALVPGINAFERLLAREDVAAASPEEIRAALHAVERFPVWNEWVGLVLSTLVIVSAVTLERTAAGVGSPNVGVIVRGGLYAIALYGAASLALGELLTRPACRAVRRIAAAAGVEPYGGFTLGRTWRIAAMVIPTVVALVVAVELGLSARGGTLAYGLLLGLSALLATGLNWLQYENAHSAVRELRDAFRDLAADREGGLVTGSIEPMLLEMANEFTTAAQHVAERRRDSGERYRAVFEAALDAIVTMDAGGRIVEFNPAAERIFGLARLDALGRRADETIAPPAADGGPVTDLVARLAAGDATLFGRRLEIDARRSDGSRFPTELTLTRIEQRGAPMVTVHLRDITNRRRAEEALTASKREVEEQAEIAASLLRVAETINVHLDQPDLFEHVSRLTVEALGCDAASIFVQDRGPRAFVLRANVGARPDIVREIQQVEFAADFPLVRQLHPGALVELADAARAVDTFPAGLAERWRIAALLAAPIVRGDDVVGVIVATYRERTGAFSPKQRHLLLGVAHATAIAFENARLIADLQAANRLKTEFVSTMSHELRTPLNVILGFCEMARDPGVSPAEREVYHERITLAGRTLLELIEGTLEVGKLETGRDDPTLATVDLTALWEKLTRECAVMPQNPDVVLEWGPSVPDVAVRADSRRLAMVVRNLVGNALKFTDRGWVRAEMLVEGGEAVLRVSDTGIGIAPEDQDRVFEMFRQADGSDSRRYAGTGLGLYLVRRFVEQFGGRVELQSTVGRGSVFTVRLPRAAGLPVGAPARGTTSGGAGPRGGHDRP